MSKKLLSLGAIQREEWIIQASLLDDTIMVIMFNADTYSYAMQYLKNELEANLFIEYVIEKGEI